MKKLLMIAALAWATVGVVVSAGQAPRTPASRAQAPAARAQAPAARPAAAPAVSTQDYKAMVDKYCVGCHNQRSNTPAAHPLVLDRVNWDNVTADADTWERVIRKLAVGAMPPQGMPRPEQTQLNNFSAYLISTLDHAANEANNAGRFTLHRLNRTEYANAIRDLLGLEVDVTALLPPDGGDFGFDNIAAALKTTPALLERYLTAAQRISTLAVGDAKAEPEQLKVNVRIDLTQDYQMEGLPPGTRGGTLVRKVFPADGEYDFAGALVRTLDHGDSGIEGNDDPVEFEISVDGVRIHSGLIGGTTDHDASGESLAAGADMVSARMKTRAFVKAGMHDVAFTFVDRPVRRQELFQLSLRSSQDLHMAGGLPKLKYVTIDGPFNPTGVSDTPSRRKIFVCKPAAASEETACARQILSSIARRAYRRPVSAEDLQSPMEFFREGRQTGGDFDAGIRLGLARILASPSFVFRSEAEQATAAPTSHRVSDLELASRLSFFLWSSIPDDELLNVAAQGRLRTPGMLGRQVRRMLQDERAMALTTNFAGQWLQLRNLERVTPDLVGFPEFDHNLRTAFQKETELFFDSVVREDRSVLDLLNADYTFMNERLARHYGVARVYGAHWRKVPVADQNRRGILGHGSVLSVTSIATRTSPVIRGKYIMTTLLGLPAPVPPPNVPTLDESTPAKKPTSVRERLESHRRNPVCASCHKNIDPLGFALENFDPVGQWRDLTEAGTPIDASGMLQDGTPVNGPVALRNWLTARPNVFVGTVTEKMLIYALGRGLEPFDMAVVREIVSDSAKSNYDFLSIITGIVESRPFQMRAKVASGAALTTAKAE